MKRIFILLMSLTNLSLACELTPELWAITNQVAKQHGLESELLAALIWQESRYCVDALSSKGAIGLGQLMPETALSLGVDPYDPEENLNGAASYLVEQLGRFGGNLELALAAYNAGPQQVLNYGGVPPFEETRSFVPNVLKHYRALKQQTVVSEGDLLGMPKMDSISTISKSVKHPSELEVINLFVFRTSSRMYLRIGPAGSK